MKRLLAAGALAAFFVALLIIVLSSSGDNDNAETTASTPTTTRAVTTRATTTTSTPGSPRVKLTAVGAYDPEGDDHENDDLAPLAVDGDTSTFWKTEHYHSFGKTGVGLVLDARQAAAAGAGARLDRHRRRLRRDRGREQPERTVPPRHRGEAAQRHDGLQARSQDEGPLRRRLGHLAAGGGGRGAHHRSARVRAGDLAVAAAAPGRARAVTAATTGVAAPVAAAVVVTLVVARVATSAAA